MEDWCKWYFKVAREIQKEFHMQLAQVRNSDPPLMSMARRQGTVNASYQIGPAPSPSGLNAVYTITNVNVPQTPLGRIVRRTLEVVAGRTDILAFPPNPPRSEPVLRTSTFRVSGQGGPPQYDQRCRAWIAQQNP
jgi:hypothetical protein